MPHTAGYQQRHKPGLDAGDGYKLAGSNPDDQSRVASAGVRLLLGAGTGDVLGGDHSSPVALRVDIHSGRTYSADLAVRSLTIRPFRRLIIDAHTGPWVRSEPLDMGAMRNTGHHKLLAVPNEPDRDNVRKARRIDRAQMRWLDRTEKLSYLAISQWAWPEDPTKIISHRTMMARAGYKQVGAGVEKCVAPSGPERSWRSLSPAA